MEQRFRVSFNSPQSGWMSLSLKAGEQSVVAVVSRLPYDSLRDLIESLAALLGEGRKGFNVKWSCEPDELDFRARATAGDRVAFKVIHYPDHRRLRDTGRVLFSLETSRLEFCLSFWRALRALHRDIVTDEFDRNWQRPFPEREMQRLTETLRAAKRDAKAASM
jgi:hypothetical protein